MMRITAIAKGRVQRVGYRYFVTACAREIGISGFVKNLPDGAVMIVAEGSENHIDEFMGMMQAESDPLIRVDTIEVIKSEPTGEFFGFGIRW